MFRSTPPLLFQPMPALHKFKIHPPLPLNPRESERLLNLLTTSFRQHLDAEHGVAFKSPPSSHHPTNTKTTNHYENGKTSRPRRRSEPARPTERHLESILSNPLFNYTPRQADGMSQTGRDPMDVFSQAVARGMMDLSYARACLHAKKRLIVESAVLDVRSSMKPSGAGLKVLKWLISSGTANDNAFLKQNEAFAEILMEFMVAEGLQEVAWSWIRRALEDVKGFGEGVKGYGEMTPRMKKEVRKDAVRPLMVLVKAEARGTGSLDAAYMVLSRAAGYLKGLLVEEMRWALGPPGRYLFYQAIRMSSELQPASESNFESFLSLIPSITVEREYYFAHLHLLHPTKPSAALALAYLRSLDCISAREKSSRSVSADHNIIKLSLDAAKFLLEHDAYDDAEWVMDYLRTTYPKQLGLQQKRELEQARAEAESLLLLEALKLA